MAGSRSNKSGGGSAYLGSGMASKAAKALKKKKKKNQSAREMALEAIKKSRK